jgi:hypothetical protein
LENLRLKIGGSIGRSLSLASGDEPNAINGWLSGFSWRIVPAADVIR